MSTYIFNGRILPERVAANLQPPQKLRVLVPGTTTEFDVTLSIVASQVAVIVDSASTIDIGTMKNQVERVVRLVVDALGYLEGCGYDAEITSVVLPVGEHIVFGVESPSLLRSKSERPVGMSDLWRVLASDPRSSPLQRALADLRESIRTPHDTSFFCFRAVESLRQSFVDPADKDSNSSWQRLRDALHIDRSWLDPLTQFSKPIRHGAFHFVSSQEREVAMHLAWKVVDRFVEYARLGFTPLPASDFEVLKHN